MTKSIIFILLTFVIFSCDTFAPEEDTEVVREDEKIYIVDRTNKKWDVTHAVEVYNFKAESFDHGLGPRAITPINNPEMISPGESGYPGSNETTQIIGTTLYNSTRAYPLNVLSRHEIVNEEFAGQPVAVGY
jgi:hypothetical protein